MTGTRIVFETFSAEYVNGPIEIMRNDSLFVMIYVARTYGTIWGTTITDTIRTYLAGFHYKDIKKIQLFSGRRPREPIIPKALIVGGAGYFVLNLANGAYFNSSITNKKNLKRLGISVGAVGAGLLINKLLKPKSFSGRKEKIEYVSMKR